LCDVVEALETRGVEFALLKGSAHWPYFCDLPEHRPQYDIDLFCPAPDEAARAVAPLGFASPRRGDGPVDHLPAMVRRTAWRWQGDYYDPEQPPSLEIHFRFWNPAAECFDVEGPEDFWTRRTARTCGGMVLPALSLPDTLSFAGLHALRHLLRGDLRLYHAYEIAHFLERSAGDARFWNTWAGQTPRSFRALQGIVFRLAARWFECRMHPIARDAMECLPRGAAGWCEMFASSPVTAPDRPNKDELLLHLCLAHGDRARILTRRLLPRPPRAPMAAHLRSWNWRFPVRRAAHHFFALFSLGVSAFRWWSVRERRLPPHRTSRSGTAPG
jgi:hypothetical protein